MRRRRSVTPVLSSPARFARVAVNYSSATFNPPVEAPRHVAWLSQGLHGDLIPQMKAANPAITGLVYKNSMYVDSTNAAAGSGAANPGAVNYADANANHSDWFLLNSGGSRITYTAYSGYTLMDIGHAGYQNAWAANAITCAQAAGWDGVFADDLSLALYSTSSTPVKYPTPADWQGAVASFLANAAAQIRAAGLIFICNTNSGVTYPAVRKSWLQYVDGTMEEGWMRPTVDRAQALSSVNDTWTKLVQQQKDHEAAGKRFFAEIPAETTDVAGVRYGLASLLLNADRWSMFNASGSSPSHTTEQWFSDFDTARALGAPSGAAVLLGGGAYRRDFANGVVVVNPTTGSQTVSLGATFSGSGLSSVSSVTLAATSGVIMVRG